MTLWTRFTAWLSGWPESSVQGKKHKHDEILFAEEEKRKQRKPKGLNPKKKKSSKKKTPKKSTKTKGLKQGNMT